MYELHCVVSRPVYREAKLLPAGSLLPRSLSVDKAPLVILKTHTFSLQDINIMLMYCKDVNLKFFNITNEYFERGSVYGYHIGQIRTWLSHIVDQNQ